MKDNCRMTTDDVTEHVVYISDAGRRRASDQTGLNCCVHSSSLRRAVNYVLRDSRPNASQKMSCMMYQYTLCPPKVRFLFFNNSVKK